MPRSAPVAQARHGAVKPGHGARAPTKLPFADIATVRTETRYDDDGYQTTLPVLVLTTREIVQLPIGTTESDVATMRAMLRS